MMKEKEKEIHEQGLVSVLLDLHRRIDSLVLAQVEGTIGAECTAKAFKGAKRQYVQHVLEMLVAFGKARALSGGRFSA